MKAQRRHVAALAAVLLAGLWPYLFVVDLVPTSRDAVMWIQKSAPGARHWWAWVFETQHFNVGYRPVTALSYAANHALGGLTPWVYRVTDLGLHLGAAAGLCVLGWLAARRSSPWGPVVGAALFLAHPIGGQVVPHLARRSYALATCLSVWGLVALCAPLPGAVAGTLAALLLGAGALSNEASYVAIPAAVLLVAQQHIHHRFSARGLAARLVPLAACLGALLVVRARIVPGGVGGYHTRAAGTRLASIVLANGHALAGTTTLRTDRPEPAAWAGWLAVAAFGVVVGWLIHHAARHREDHGDGALHGVLAAWMAGLFAVYALVDVWFPRQAYAPLAPWSLLLGLVMVDTARRRDPLALAPAVLVGLVLWQSPILFGTDRAKVACWRRTDAVTRAAIHDLASLPRGARVHAVLPYYGRPSLDALRARERKEGRAPFAAKQAEMWIDASVPARVEVVSLVVTDPLHPGAPLLPRRHAHGLEVGIPDAEVYLLESGARVEERAGARLIVLPSRRGRRRASHVYVHTGQEGVLTEP